MNDQQHQNEAACGGMKLAASVLVDADHLADTAERLLAALNAATGAQERFDSTGYAVDAEALELAEETVTEYWRSVRSATYEYRKRAERARAAIVPNAELTGRLSAGLCAGDNDDHDTKTPPRRNG